MGASLRTDETIDSYFRTSPLSDHFLTSPATTCPLISEGGTPGPGTVNCQVYQKFESLRFFIFGLRKAV